MSATVHNIASDDREEASLARVISEDRRFVSNHSSINHEGCMHYVLCMFVLSAIAPQVELLIDLDLSHLI